MVYKIESNRFYIYMITNIINSKIYIGQTNCLQRRVSQYKSSVKNYTSLNECSVILKSMIKYGFNNFKFDIIAMSWDRENINELEKQLIAQYNCIVPSGYNVAIGGDNFAKDEEIKRKISIGINKYYETHSSPRKGIPMPEEWRNAISKASIGKPGTNTGKVFPVEWRIKMSKSLSGKIFKEKRRFSEEVEKEICTLYLEQKSIYWLAINYNCYRSLIISILDRNNIKRRKSNYTGHSNHRRRFTDQQENEICALYKDGIIRSDLARQFDCSRNTITSILFKHGVLKEVTWKEEKIGQTLTNT
jgi:group I intron endonuclease